MKTNLSAVGSEIVHNISNSKSVSFSPAFQSGNNVTKSYKIINDTITSDKSTKSIQSFNKKSSSNEYKQYKKPNSLNLSNIMYKDGCILTDAINSNPGFGLWAIRTKTINTTSNNNNVINTRYSEMKNTFRNKKKEKVQNKDSKITNKTANKINNKTANKITNKIDVKDIKDNKDIKDIKDIKDNKVSNTKTEINNEVIKEDNKENNESINKNNSVVEKEMSERRLKNKKIIDELTLRCNDLEKKYTNTMTGYQEKEQLCKNIILMKKEYEKILNNNISETKELKTQFDLVKLENTKLTNSYNSARAEINRLLDIINSDKEKFQKLKNDFEDRLAKEKMEQKRLQNILSINEDEILALQEKEKIEANDKNDKNPEKQKPIKKYLNLENKNGSKMKDYEIDELNDIITELQFKISDMRDKINKTEIECGKLKEILKYKDKKEELEGKRIQKLYDFANGSKKNDLEKKKIIQKQNEIIAMLKNQQINNNNNIRNHSAISNNRIVNNIAGRIRYFNG